MSLRVRTALRTGCYSFEVCSRSWYFPSPAFFFFDAETPPPEALSISSPFDLWSLCSFRNRLFSFTVLGHVLVVCVLATILAAWTFIDRSDPVDSARQLLQITWVATFIVAAIIGYQARGVVFGEKAGLDVLTELNGLSRSSGVADGRLCPDSSAS